MNTVESVDTMESVDIEGKQQASSPAHDTPEMPDHSGTDRILAQLWAANQAAFTDEDYETACDTLQAALARARYLHDATQVTAVGRAAAEQYQRLFEEGPDRSQVVQPNLYPSRRDAIRLVYASIAQQAPALVSLVERLRLHSWQFVAR